MDLAALTTYLQTNLPELAAGDLTAEIIAGGRSNLTYFISNDNTTFVLRRPPLGHVLDTAHDMSREYRVISALHGTSVPVAAPLLFCDDTDVIGSPFYLMEKVEGVVLRDFDDAVAIGPAQIPALSYRLVNTLGRLHATDPEAVGLEDFGRPEGFLERQIRRWTKQLKSSQSREVPGIDDLAAKLAARIPETQRTAIVHGDYRLDNVIVHRGDDGYDVAAVVDWEMSTLGDPLTDIGLFCVYWSGLGAATLVPGADVTDPPAPFPSTDAVISTYADSSGLDLEPLPWYIAFGSFKLAVIIEGIHYRHSLGKTVGDGFGGIGDLVQPLVDRGLLSLDQAGM